jgi:hypothetical protein
VLVVDGRVAAYTRWRESISIGDRWDSTRKTLEAEELVCVMEGT